MLEGPARSTEPRRETRSTGPGARSPLGLLRVCPHCWGVNPRAERLCASCGADMHTLLQESGGLRRTAPVQSPVPVRARLSTLQRAVVFVCLVMLALVHVLGAIHAIGRRPGLPLPQPLGSGVMPAVPVPE